MGRPSKLTEKQWAEIGRRLLAGEKAASLAREFKITEGAIVVGVAAEKAKATEEQTLRDLYERLQRARNDEEYVTLLLRMFLHFGVLGPSLMSRSPVKRAKFEHPVEGGKIDLLLLHEDGGATIIEAKADGTSRNVVSGIGQLCFYAAQLAASLPTDLQPTYVRRWLVAPAAHSHAIAIDRACELAGVFFWMVPTYSRFSRYMESNGFLATA